MSISQARSKRKSTGSRYRDFRGKKHHECGNIAVNTKIGQLKAKQIRKRGGEQKNILLNTDIINVMDTKTKKAVKAKIQNVIDNPANVNFVRANILTRGTVIETDKGKARITNRPGQEGTVNGVLI